MTNQEAIEVIKLAQAQVEWEYPMDYATAFDMAISALETQPEKVKCKKCRYVYYDKEFGNYWCDRKSDTYMVEEDGYCKWGK